MGPKALTIRGEGLLNALKCVVMISTPLLETEIPQVQKDYMGIWDTGATNSVVTPKVVKDLGLKPTGAKQVHAAGITEMRPTYLVDVYLPMAVTVQKVEVTEATLTSEDDVLIGMDIIGLGDFSVTNTCGKTVMSFRIPSQREVDFVAELQPAPLNRQQRRQAKLGRGPK